jgi:hypothetical protein
MVAAAEDPPLGMRIGSDKNSVNLSNIETLHKVF